MTEPPNDLKISYTARELLKAVGDQVVDMDRKLDLILQELNRKAEKTELEVLRSRFDEQNQMLWKHEQVQVQYVPLFNEVRMAVDEHLRSPHVVASRLTERVEKLENFRWYIMGFSAAIGIAVGIITRLA